MNDFSEIENELKKLRPIQPSPELFARVDAELRGAEAKIIRPERFRISWLSLGAGLAAAAAVVLLFVYSRFEKPTPEQRTVVSHPPSQSYGTTGSKAATARSTTSPFVPAGATQVVYRTEDEGLLFPSGSEQPVRRVRAQVRETLQWQNQQTGASLRVSYPAEEVTLLPVYGH
jgi:hypothetical protein